MTELLPTLAVIYSLQASFCDPAPLNDDFVNATILEGVAFRATGNLEHATMEPDELANPNISNGPSIWFRWVSPDDGAVRLAPHVNWLGRGFGNTEARLFRGETLLSLEPIQRWRWNPSIDVYPVVNGAAYVIQLAVCPADGWPISDHEMSFQFDPRPSHDDFEHRMELAGIEFAVTNIITAATTEPGEPQLGVPPSNLGGKTLWFEWTAPAAGFVKLYAFAYDLDLWLGVYSGERLAELKPVEHHWFWDTRIERCANESRFQSSLLRVTPGEKLNIQLGVSSAEVGDNLPAPATDNILALSFFETPTVETRALLQSDGRLAVSVWEASGFHIVLQASTDLTVWQTVADSLEPWEWRPPFWYRDSEVALRSQRFFRTEVRWE
jgi:hypothetical protein